MFKLKSEQKRLWGGEWTTYGRKQGCLKFKWSIHRNNGQGLELRMWKVENFWKSQMGSLKNGLGHKGWQEELFVEAELDFHDKDIVTSSCLYFTPFLRYMYFLLQICSWSSHKTSVELTVNTKRLLEAVSGKIAKTHTRVKVKVWCWKMTLVKVKVTHESYLSKNIKISDISCTSDFKTNFPVINVDNTLNLYCNCSVLIF